MRGKVKVYAFRRPDPAGYDKRRPVKGTVEAIERARGTVIPGTEETIDASLLDGAGYYRLSN
jgi:hypothetical protein